MLTPFSVLPTQFNNDQPSSSKCCTNTPYTRLHIPKVKLTPEIKLEDRTASENTAKLTGEDGTGKEAMKGNTGKGRRDKVLTSLRSTNVKTSRLGIQEESCPSQVHHPTTSGLSLIASICTPTLRQLLLVWGLPLATAAF
jgi:hypothetical protein